MPNKHYETLFLGLKKNHPHSVALVQPISYLVRRVIYAALIVFMHDSPFFVTVALLCMSLALLAFVCSEHQWESSVVNWQHIVSEVGFYGCIILILYLSSVGIHSTTESDAIAWTMITVVFAFMLFNTVCIFVSSVRFLKLKILLLQRKYANLKRRRKSGKISPLMFVVDKDDDISKGGQTEDHNIED